jgi:hypothetical protein
MGAGWSPFCIIVIMKKTLPKAMLHLLLWAGVWFFFYYFFSYNSPDKGYVLWFASLLLPLTAALTYFSVYFLIPRYLFPKDYGKLALYGFFTLVASSYVIVLIIYGCMFIYRNFDPTAIPPMVKNFFFILILAAGTVLSLLAMSSLPAGPRTGLRSKTIEEAVSELKSSNLNGWELVHAATNLVDDRMFYCRRNNLQHFRRAFSRGLGFCQQQAFALTAILEQLGFDAHPVQAVKCRFPDNSTGGHSWVQVNYAGEIRFVDPLLQDRETGKIRFEPLSRVTRFSAPFRIFSSWGSSFINAVVYFRTGSDEIRF